MTGTFPRGWIGRLRQALGGVAVEGPQAVRIEIRGQRWLGPGEMFRVIEIESEGRRQQFALWTSRQAGQMTPLEAAPARTESQERAV